MDKFWKKVTTEKVSEEHKQKVLTAAHDFFKDQKVPALWRWSFSIGIAMAAMTAFWIYSQNIQMQSIPTFEITEEEYEDLDVVSDLELYEDLEVLEQWSSI